ncbi:MAG: hypothetical protein SGJ20_04440, partial [Planctomycetota bacterium]|nr:hypothetical protein [Planctomycetota bacterium]
MKDPRITFKPTTTTVTRWLCRFRAVAFVLAAFMSVSYAAWAVASPRRGLSLLERNAKQHLPLAQNLPWCTSSGPAIHGRAFTRIADAWGHQQSMRVHPATVTDALGRTTTYSYDANGNKSAESITGGITRSWSYVPSADFVVSIKNRARSFTDARGIAETYEYDGKGHLSSRTRGAFSESFGYDSNGDRVQHVDFNGGMWSFGFDAFGFPSNQSNPLNQMALLTYDTRGRMTGQTDAEGNRTVYEYDDSDRRVSSTVSGPGGGVLQTAYAPGGREQTVTDEIGKVTVNRFDALGRLTQVRNALGVTRALEYDGNGNLTQETDFRGHPTIYAYDDANRLETKTEPLGKVTTFEHDALGHVLSESVSGPASVTRITNYRYAHPLYFRTRVEQLGGQGGSRVQDIEPDAAGNALTTTDALARVTTRVFDAFDRTTSIQEPGRLTTLSYDANGNQLSQTVGNRTRSWVYDGANRNIRYTDGAQHISRTSYFANGEPKTRTDANGGVVTYTLDARNRVIGQRGPRADQNTQAVYDGAGNRTEETLSNNRTLVHT